MKTVYENRQWWLDDQAMPSKYVPFFDRMGAIQFREMSKYPFISRDITFSNNKSVEELLLDIVANGGKYLELVVFLGEYKDDSKHTKSFRLIFQSLQRTLETKEVDDIINKIENIDKIIN